MWTRIMSDGSQCTAFTVSKTGSNMIYTEHVRRSLATTDLDVKDKTNSNSPTTNAASDFQRNSTH